MKTVLILTMHGIPPKDFPRREIGEYFGLHTQMENSPQRMDGAARQRYAELNHKMRSFPRTPENDPFYFSSQEMAQRLTAETGIETLFCFNEFCNPTLADAAATAAASGAERVLVLTPMMTRGGEHAEKDIPDEIEALRQTYPALEIEYAWPFDPAEITRFLASQVKRFI
jgi:sirohydrochlorin cobaltochelatase